MPRLITNYPQIIAASGATAMLETIFDLANRHSVTEAAYSESLKAAFGKVNSMKNIGASVILKVIGSPPQSRPELSDGIEETKLDMVAQFLFGKRPELLPRGKQPTWHTFAAEIFPTPQYLEYLNASAYFKFLTAADKQIVEGYVLNRLGELGFLGNDAAFYTINVWNKKHQQVRNGLLQINRKENIAFCTRFSINREEIEALFLLRTDMQNGAYAHYDTSLNLTMVPEDPKSQMSLYISVNFTDKNFFQFAYLKGTSNISKISGNESMAADMILKRFDSYDDAMKEIKKPDEIDAAISISLIDKRIENYEVELDSLNKLKSAPIAKLVDEIKGTYILGYLSITNYYGNEGKMTIGYCQIRKNGIVTFKFPYPNIDYVKGFIAGDKFIGADMFDISYLLNTPYDPCKFNYGLQIKRTSNYGIEVIHGAMSGWFREVPFGTRVALVKLGEENAFEGVVKNSTYEKVYASEDAKPGIIGKLWEEVKRESWSKNMPSK